MTKNSIKIRQALQEIRNGNIIAYPTEAVYGLGCDPLNEQAVLNLLALKQRDMNKGLILIASSLSQLEPYLQLNNTIRNKVAQTWPGPVTWIIPAQIWVPQWLTGRHSSLAVRVSAHPIARLLCQQNGGPIVSSSANTHAKSPATKAWQVADRLNNRDLWVVPGKVGSLKQATPIYDVLNQQQIR